MPIGYEIRHLTDDQRGQLRCSALQQSELAMVQAQIRLYQAEADLEAARRAMAAVEALFAPADAGIPEPHDAEATA